MPETDPVSTDTGPKSIPAGQPRPIGSRSAEPVQPNVTVLAAAGGDPAVWGAELFAFSASGGQLSEESLVSWFSTFGSQVAASTFRSALFQVANTPLPSSPQGDPAILLLQLRDDLAHELKHSAGL